MSQPHHTPPPPSFTTKKSHILSLLSVPTEQYDDLSPKGSVDVNIRDLIDEINTREGSVTTSSCGGRVSVFLEGKRSAGERHGEIVQGSMVEEGKERETKAGVGGKGGGGRWLFVSHDPVSLDSNSDRTLAELLGMVRNEKVEGEMSGRDVGEMRFIHFKFEPMILHILTSSPTQAQTLLTAALQSGFRESGALNLTSPPSSSSNSPTPIVAIRSMGLSLESIIGFLPPSSVEETPLCIVPEWQLRNLIQIANERFVENEKRIERFRVLLREGEGEKEGRRRGQEGSVWEDGGARRERKRAEGLRMREVRMAEKARENSDENEDMGEGLGLGGELDGEGC
ncbi:hypothetical protein HYFRA_00008803 [Hymenoscyphus fraxineus]|uniref:tRNA(Phe) 7-[(3-amino-3-carboxypropyl)-4-demethylwyosine(37)-N(4)]-methyltransferase n=1 Tax=Hymenoscyphus fraxineus TaxID=746836 RepID=A0A9N9KY16_9HELO|nr:hypothetical protein HYFRA_00008803 [Hymenoscyphus fraxineus]